ncbi:hypothetical protein HYC85_013241 [Camellia sinensis]|uniref:Uncharacterized protein n=1 Tax=Camellia sinensis TaxID=4442 RepID=A0A7J7H605_CAMSI|nr:hypothetical protein HYC85_013241 [Camellia sinensis]
MKISFFLCSEELLASLRETLKSIKDIPHILKAGSCILTDLAYVYELVIGVIDVSRSKDKGYGTIVKEGFCDELDELRQIYEELPEFLEEVLVFIFFSDHMEFTYFDNTSALQVSSLELARLPIMSGGKFLPCIVYLHQIEVLAVWRFGCGQRNLKSAIRPPDWRIGENQSATTHSSSRIRPKCGRSVRFGRFWRIGDADVSAKVPRVLVMTPRLSRQGRGYLRRYWNLR